MCRVLQISFFLIVLTLVQLVIPIAYEQDRGYDQLVAFVDQTSQEMFLSKTSRKRKVAITFCWEILLVICSVKCGTVSPLE